MKSCSIRGKQLFFQDVGQGPAILFGHSYLWNSHMWQPQIEALSKTHRCIAPDLWGHGQSEALPSLDNISIASLADDFFALMQHLAIEKFSVIGLSVGGMWATQLALQHPEAVNSLVIMDSYVGPEEDGPRALYFGMIDSWQAEQQFSEDMIEEVTPYFFSPKTFISKPAVIKNFQDDLRAFQPEKMDSICSIGKAIFSRESLLEPLKTLSIPTLVVVGEDDLPRPPKEAKEMAEIIPNAQLSIVEDAGHICTLEQPDVVTALLAGHLAINKKNRTGYDV